MRKVLTIVLGFLLGLTLSVIACNQGSLSLQHHTPNTSVDADTAVEDMRGE